MSDPSYLYMLVDLAKNPVPSQYREYTPDGNLVGEKGGKFRDTRVKRLKEIKGKEISDPEVSDKSDLLITPAVVSPDCRPIEFKGLNTPYPKPYVDSFVANRHDLNEVEKKGPWYYQGDMGHEYKIINAACRYGTTNIEDLIDISRRKSGITGRRIMKTRLNEEQLKSAIAGLDSAINKSITANPLTLYRGLKVINFEGGYKNLSPGDIIFDRAFASTTTDKNRGLHFAHEQDDGSVHLMRIHAPAGTKGLFFNDYEHEFLLARNTALQIRAINKEVHNGQEMFVYDMEIVGEVTPAKPYETPEETEQEESIVLPHSTKKEIKRFVSDEMKRGLEDLLQGPKELEWDDNNQKLHEDSIYYRLSLCGLVVGEWIGEEKDSKARKYTISDDGRDILEALKNSKNPNVAILDRIDHEEQLMKDPLYNNSAFKEHVSVDLDSSGGHWQKTVKESTYTEGESMALDYYWGAGYRDMNLALLGSKPFDNLMSAKICNLDNMIRKSSISEPCILHNGCPTSLGSLILNGVYNKGDVLQMNTYMSTSIDPNICTKFLNKCDGPNGEKIEVFLEINQKADAPCVYFGKHNYEKEVLLPRDVQLQIKRIDKLGSRCRVVCDRL